MAEWLRRCPAKAFPKGARVRIALVTEISSIHFCSTPTLFYHTQTIHFDICVPVKRSRCSLLSFNATRLLRKLSCPASTFAVQGVLACNNRAIADGLAIADG